MLLLHAIDRVRHLGHIPLRFFDCCVSITLPLPSEDVTLEFVVFPLLLFDVFAEFANVRLIVRRQYELESAGLPGPVLFVTLFPKVSPSPKSALPTSLVEVTHWVLQRRSTDAMEVSVYVPLIVAAQCRMITTYIRIV